MKISCISMSAKPWLISIVFGLASCGGGEGGGGNDSTPISYTGLSTPVELPADGSKTPGVLTDYLDMDNILRADMNAGVFAAPPVPAGPLQTKMRAAFKILQKTQAAKRTRAEVVSYQSTGLKQNTI